MALKSAAQRYFSILLITGLVACGRQADRVTPTPGLTAVDRTAEAAAFQTAAVQTVKAMPTFGPAATNTQAQSFLPTVSFFTFTPGPSLTSAPTRTPSSVTPAPTRTPLPFMPLNGLRVAYSIGGDLYVQDSGKQAVQLTHKGQDDGPIFSDDGQKIVFYRGEGKNQLWSINIDGTEEQTLIIPARLAAFGETYTNESLQLRALVFVPDTHQLLFNTHIHRGRFDPPEKNDDLLLIDTDTGEVKQLLAPGQGGDFLVSPDGKRIAVQMPDHIDVIDLQGQTVRHNLVTYPVYKPPAKVPMTWMPNSKELIVLPSKFDPWTAGIPVLREVWQYSLESSSGRKIPLNPPPIDDSFGISPDGNWIAYSYEPNELDPDAKTGVYLGNLPDGTSRLIFMSPLSKVTGFLETVPFYYDWSPGSVYFSCYYEEVYLGNIHGEFNSLGLLGPRESPAWIDGNRYLLEGGSVLVEVGNPERFRVVDIPPGVIEPSAFVFLKH